MANNATHVWMWDGRTDGVWEDANWTDGAGTPVDDYPDSAEDAVTMYTSGSHALITAAGAHEVGSIVQESGYSGAVCVENITAASVVLLENGTVTGGTIGMLTATGGTVVDGTITTLKASGSAVVAGGTIAALYASDSASVVGGTFTLASMNDASTISGGTFSALIWNSTGGEICGTFGESIQAYKDLEFGGGNITFDATATTIRIMRRGVLVTADLDTHTYAGNLVLDNTYAYGYPKEQ